MGVVVERMDLTVTSGADLNGGAGVLTPCVSSFDEESGGVR
jgi:hypothetical protein